METLRAFIAIEIDQQTKQRLFSLISHLKKSNADVKWANETQMHLTLKFLGNIKEEDVQRISNALGSILKGQNIFTIRFSKIGTFPNLNRPRVIWLGIDKGGDFLKTLNAKIEIELGKLGFKKEVREFKPHFTLGRVRSLKNVADLTNSIKEITLDFKEELRIDKIILFKSTLTPKGAIYEALSKHSLPH